ncbi:hypothetical protein M3Y99_00222300 [Aphelenchoides fujianensis]|nr:hypothetical protein M3Y99_00222300 [Aphelenchoides fujianensis]
MAAVKRKPQIRAAVRDGRNRFVLVDAIETDEKKGPIQLVRLASISRAQLASVRRCARCLKFEQDGSKWRLRLEVGHAATPIVFPVEPRQMSGIVRVVRVPVRLDFGHGYASLIEWTELEQLAEFVTGLVWRYHESSACYKFVNKVTPQLRELECSSSFLERFWPLNLEKLALDGPRIDYSLLARHEVRRLDVPLWEVHRKFPPAQVLSASIRALGLTCVDVRELPLDKIAAFRRRFPALEDLHIVLDYSGSRTDLSAHFTRLWTKCLEARDRLHVAGLKRLFFVVAHTCTLQDPKTDWIERLKRAEPFDRATFSLDPSGRRVRVSLKVNWPHDAKPTFFHITGDFHCAEDEAEAALKRAENAFNWRMGVQEAAEDEAMEVDETNG